MPATLVSSLVQTARSLLTADCEPADANACMKLLELALQHASALPSGPEREAHLGAIHAHLAEAQRRVGRLDHAQSECTQACQHFGTIDRSDWRTLSQFVETYVAALEQSGAGDMAAAFLLDERKVNTSETVFIDTAHHRQVAGDVASTLALLLESASRHHPAAKTWAVLEGLIDQQGARAALAEAVCRPEWKTSEANRKRFLQSVGTRLAGTDDDPDLRIIRGVLLAAGDDGPGAVADLSAAFAARPGDRTVGLTLASLLLRLGRGREARDLLGGLGAATSDDETARLLLAEALGRSDDWLAAVAILDDLLARRPDSPVVLSRKALGLARLGRHEEALRLVGDALARDGAQPDAWRLKTSILIEQGRLDDAGEALANALKAGLEDGRLGALFLRKAKAHLDLGEIERADEALGIARKLAPRAAPSDHGLLSEVFSGLGRCEPALKAAEDGLAGSPGAPDLLIVKARALRQLGRQTEALRIIVEVARRHQSLPLLRLHALLLCDIGDFTGALTLLQSVTERVDEADHMLLGIRGWAHQNLEGSDHGIEGERVYRAALRQRPGELWYRKGLANALRRIPGRLPEALAEYGRVIAEVEKRRDTNALTPHLQCVAAWSFCQRGDPETAADWYTAALSARRMGIAVQFDYALVLAAGGHGGAALDEYRRTIDEVQDKDVLRRCGLICVALGDIRAAASQGVIGTAQSTSTAEIRKALRGALLAAADQVPADFDSLPATLRAFVARDEASPGPETDAPDWSRLDVVGFHRPDREDDLDLLRPVLVLREAADVHYILREDRPEPLVVDRLQEQVATGEVIRLPVCERSSADTRVLFVAETVLEAIDLGDLNVREQGLAWQWVAQPVRGAACITSAHHGEAVLRTLTEKVAEVAITRVVDRPGDPGAADPDILRLARLALRATTDEQVAYKALLAYGIAHGDPAPMVESLGQRLGSRWDLNGEQARSAVEDFRELLTLRTRRAAERPAAQVGSLRPSGPTDALTKQLLERARRIGAIQDPEEQFREALRAATEVEALVPEMEAFEAVRRELTTRLESQASFYLETADSVLLLACDPAFYSSSTVLALTRRPAVNSFAFVKAASRYRGHTPLSFTHARRWWLP